MAISHQMHVKVQEGGRRRTVYRVPLALAERYKVWESLAFETSRGSQSYDNIHGGGSTELGRQKKGGGGKLLFLARFSYSHSLDPPHIPLVLVTLATSSTGSIVS